MNWNGTYSIWGEIQLNDAKCVGLFGQTSGLLSIHVFQLVQTTMAPSIMHALGCLKVVFCPSFTTLRVLAKLFLNENLATRNWHWQNLTGGCWWLLDLRSKWESICKRRLYPFLFLSLKALFIGFCLFNDALPRMKTRKMQLWNLWRRKTSHPSVRVQKAVRRIPSGSKRQKDSKVTKDAFLCWAFRKCTSCSTYGISDSSEFLPLESLELQSGHRQNHLSPLQRWRHH